MLAEYYGPFGWLEGTIDVGDGLASVSMAFLAWESKSA